MALPFTISGGGQDGNEPFGLGALELLEPAVATHIAQVDEFALEDFAVQPALGHFDGAFAHVTGREAPPRWRAKLSRAVKQAKRYCALRSWLWPVCSVILCSTTVGSKLELITVATSSPEPKIIVTCHCVSPLPPPAMPGRSRERYRIQGDALRSCGIGGPPCKSLENVPPGRFPGHRGMENLFRFWANSLRRRRVPRQ